MREFFEFVWKESLFIYDESKIFSFFGKYFENYDVENVMEDDMFFVCGGFFLSVVRFVDLIEFWICNRGKVYVEFYELLDNIFNKIFGFFCIYVESKFFRMFIEVRGDFNNRLF